MKKAKLSKSNVRLRNKRTGKKEFYWKVITPKLGGGSIRRFFKEEVDADTFLEQQEIQIRNYGIAGAGLDPKTREEAISAVALLAPLGATITEAAKHYAAFLNSTRGGIPLPDAVDLLLKSRAASIFSPHYRQSLKHRLGWVDPEERRTVVPGPNSFVAAFQGKTTTQISKEDIASFLSKKKSIETQKSFRRNIKTLFTFLIENHKHSIDPVPALAKAKGFAETKWSVEILSPEECSRILSSCDAETLPSVAIGMFCGLRASEINRLDWKKVELDEQRIVIDSSVARKVGSRRVVPIPETCVAWLLPYAKTSGKVESENFRKLFDEVRISAGFRPSNTREWQKIKRETPKTKLKPWPSNCLRHGAISYALAECGDESKVAFWAGNSPSMIKNHYDAQAKKSDAVKFYAIRPSTPKNVIGMKSVAA